MQNELTLTETRTYSSTKTIEKRIKVPSRWGCFSSQDNNSFKKKGETLYKNILKVKNGTNDYIDYLKAFDNYFKSYIRTVNKNSGRGLFDTAVRDSVKGFALDLAKSVNVSTDTIRDLWDRRI